MSHKFAAMRAAGSAELDVLEEHDEKLNVLDHDVRLQLGSLNRLVRTNQTICEDGFETLHQKIDKIQEDQQKILRLLANGSA